LFSLCTLGSVIIESLSWTVVTPVPVVMELNGPSSKSSPLGEASQAAVAYISSHIRSHTPSLKIQTYKGNDLSSLGTGFWERNHACGDLAMA
jgi:protein SMG6